MKLWNPLESERKPFAEEFRADMNSDNILRSRMGKMLFDLVRHLTENVSGPEACAVRFENELLLTFAHAKDHSVSMKIWIDSDDYAPLVNGMPLFHYRVQYRLNCDVLSIDRRCREIPEVVEVIFEGINRCR